MRSVLALIMLALVAVISAPASAAAGSEVEAEAIAACPAYGDHLARARTALERGDRASAIAALKEAVGTLRRCAEEEEAGASGPLLGHAQPTRSSAGRSYLS